MFCLLGRKSVSHTEGSFGYNTPGNNRKREGEKDLISPPQPERKREGSDHGFWPDLFELHQKKGGNHGGQFHRNIYDFAGKGVLQPVI